MLQTYANHELPSSLWTNYKYIDLMPEGDLNDCVAICNGLTKNIKCDYFAYTSDPVPRCYIGELECPRVQPNENPIDPSILTGLETTTHIKPGKVFQDSINQGYLFLYLGVLKKEGS
mgnify:CR=1 FL=1